MGITKSNIFTEEQNYISSMAKVLGHPARIAILQYLISKQTCINSDLVEEIGLAQATISQHLREMKSIGLIKGNIEGTKICYCINEEKYLELKRIFDKILGQSLSCNNSC